MNLSMYNPEVFLKYKSKSQIAKNLTEPWLESNAFCPICLNPHVALTPNNTKVYDFLCNNCHSFYQLKSQKSKFGKRINDGAFSPMINYIRLGKVPNFFLLKYSLSDYFVDDLMLIPNFFFVESIIEKRNSLRESADRAGWIGCNILLHKIPMEGRIDIIKDRKQFQPKIIKKSYDKIKFMSKIPIKERGWTNDVLNIINSLEAKKFSLQDAYSYEDKLFKSHPNNKNIKAKIRQQLQILRDKGFLKFEGSGTYSLRD